ncbi:MAG: SoxR reducing system RseC family protein [Gammaproteobacteria bacterium]|nr:SoxR reducing system RseC family protein [Gammaproteobacteria bacterium]
MGTEPLRVTATVRAAGELDCAPASGCPRCARGEGCGQAAWFSGRGPRRLHLATGAAQPGEQVTLELPAPRLLQATALVYGPPLAGLLGGALLGQPAGEAWAALGGMAGLVAGAALARWLAWRLAPRLAPVVVVGAVGRP